MTEHPKLLRGDMVRAVLDGRKTQTRVPVKLTKKQELAVDTQTREEYRKLPKILEYSPLGVPGDVLWVRETWRPEELDNGCAVVRFRADDGLICIHDTHSAQWLQWYHHGGWRQKPIWRPSIHMPYWACRLKRNVKRTWVERVRDISEEDCYAEGAKDTDRGCLGAYVFAGEIAESYESIHDVFRSLWDSIYAKDGFGWSENPWVFGCEFERRAAL